ncbi:uncharacterized protein LOC136083590 [Hydra vulgaris]|uniref:Uncharacterized protein LOC136083590 n=1 Tax=Hydra vulgaris TaxID=6087 RepID=A0ABM4CBM9_HYDVU
MLKSIKPHNGYNSCERCIVEGEYKENRAVFNDIGCALRSDQDFSQGKYQPLHQLGKSVFVDYGFPCVLGFVLDRMHLVMLGVVRRILLFLKEGPRICKLSQLQLNEISKNLEYLKGKLPSEFARQPRSLKELSHWKATEFKQFILYTGPVVLKGVVSNEAYTHFLAFSIAIRIMCSTDPDKRAELLQYAKNLLEWFFFKSKNVYGESFITYNVHSLIHLHQDVENYGEDLLSLSAFPFENYMHVLKKFIHSANNPLVQIIKRCSELEKSGESITHQYINDKIGIADRDS